MAINSEQLETWSHQGTVQQSSATYATVKAALEAADAPYAERDFNVFLQGSYGNDTNIRSESDVDVVIQLKNTFQHNISELPQDQQAAFKAAYSDATYTHANFKGDVLAVLKSKFGADISESEKAILIASRSSRRTADVVVAIQYRRYQQFLVASAATYDGGICFYTASGTKIINYPRQHSKNLTKKHQSTNSWFKPMVRIFKNLRSRAVAKGLLNQGDAPSYYLEGLLYNVPDSTFGDSYMKTFVAAFNWIMEADRSTFVCANEYYPLLMNGSPVTWRADKCDAFLEACVKIWNEV